MLPTITVEGRLTADPELRFTPQGKAVASFTVASSDRVKNKSTDQWEDGDSLFLRTSCWDKLAENVAESLEKGDLVIVQGKLKQRSYEDREGNKRTVVELTAFAVAPSLQFRTIKHGEGKATRGSAAAEPVTDPWASSAPADEAPPF
jgi:single-strand DNA-binding protein